MRRLLAIAALLLAAALGLASSAESDDSHTYRVELDNAFGLTQGGDLRIAGVIAGTITDVGINEDKRAVVTIETSGPISVLGEETTCSSEPQSLIAEYFLDCKPAGDPLPEEGLIPVEQTSQTVQADLFQNMSRDPIRDRLRLLINEFGTGLAGNAEGLEEAVRRGAPALANLERALDILADQHRTLREINEKGDRIISRLAERREDVRAFILSARDAAAASAERRADLSRDFDLLDDFLAELGPTLSELDGVARQGEPLMSSLRDAAPGLTELSERFGPFAGSAEVGLRALGDASEVGQRAVEHGRDEVHQVRQVSKKLGFFEQLKDFLRDLSDPRRAVEVDARAARTCDDPTRSCWATGRKAPTGYTAIEGLLNYAYYLTGATNQYDATSHILHFSFYDVGNGPCGPARVPGDPASPDFGVPAAGGGFTTDLLEAHPCVAWLGPNQPGMNEDIGLPDYDPSVCPDGSAAPEVCDPNGASTVSAPTLPAGGGNAIPLPELPGGGGKDGNVTEPPADAGEQPPSGGPGSGSPIPGLPDLGLPELGKAGKALGHLGLREGGRGPAPSPEAANDLMRYLLG